VPELRPLRDADVPDVLALNHANVQMLAPMDEEHLRRLRSLADRFDVLESDGAFAGFVVTVSRDTAYDSDNFAWFHDRHRDGTDFYYLDRVVLDQRFRRQGLGGFVYDEIEAAAAPHGRLCLEVNLVPRNDPSLAFHASRGFVEVGQRGDEEHVVAMLEKPL
jgi:predicted GNAT superfamily acetyltransferase